MAFPSVGFAANYLLGTLAGGAFFALFAVLTKGKAMGWGDAKLAAAGGLILGLADIVFSIALAFIAGGLVGAVLVTAGRKRMKSRLPFAPFLAGGMAFTVLLGYEALEAYFELLL